MLGNTIAMLTYAGFAAVSSNAQTTLRIGMDTNFAPYAFKNGSQLAGFGYDIAMGLNAHCPNDLNIVVVETRWANCWGTGVLGPLIDAGTGGTNANGLDGCMTYTNTLGVRQTVAEFSHAILKDNRPAGILTLLNADGTPKVNGLNDLAGKRVMDVGGWAPTQDTFALMNNHCTGQKYSTNISWSASSPPPSCPAGVTCPAGVSNVHACCGLNANDVAIKALRDGNVDAVYVYADQAEEYMCSNPNSGSKQCSLWNNFGTDYAYIQTGQLHYLVNGTTLVMGKKNVGKAAMVNSCLNSYMRTAAYYNVCQKYKSWASIRCYPNSHFPAGAGATSRAHSATNQGTSACSTGYCSCPANAPVNTHTSGQGSFSVHVAAMSVLALIFFW